MFCELVIASLFKPSARSAPTSSIRARSIQHGMNELVLALLVFALCAGCGTKVPSSSKPASAADSATVANPPDQPSRAGISEEPSPAQPSTAALATNVSEEKPTDSVQKSSKGLSENSSPATSSTSTPGAKESRANSPKLVAPSAEQIAKWKIPDHASLRLLTCLDGFGDAFIHCAAISPDGKKFVLGGVKLTVWNLTATEPSADLLAEIKGTEIERPIRAVAISPDGNWLAAGDQKGWLRIWNFADLSEAVKVRAHDARLLQLAFSPNSQTLATTSYSGEVRFWQVADGKKISSAKVSDHELARLAFLSDTRLIGAGRETSIWNVEEGKKEQTLTTAYITGPSLGLSQDRQQLAYGDQDSKVQIWDVKTSALTDQPLIGAGAQLIDFSHDGRRIATCSRDSNLRIWDIATGQVIQVIDADGGRTTGLEWIPNSDALMVVSEIGRVRIWGTDEQATSLGLTTMLQPVPPSNPVSPRKPFNSQQLQRVIDIRSLPKLPGAVPQWGDVGMLSYSAPATIDEAEQFYRYTLGKAGWKESSQASQGVPGLLFQKDGCHLNLSFTPGADEKQLQVSFQFMGNFDVRQVPPFKPTASKSTFSSFSSVMYRTKAELLDIEVGMLKLLHAAGWTPYSRLAAAGQEDPEARMMSFIQEASILTLFIGRPADAPDEFSIQVSTQISNKSLPVPPDSGWIEFDNSTKMQLVANTKMDLKQTADFYDREMAADEWIARDAGRNIKEDRAFMPFIRGQQDVLIRLVARSDGSTRIIVGEAEQSSWQLEKSKKDDNADTASLEAADVPLPKGATTVKFEIDQKQILFDLSESTPPDVAAQFAKLIEPLGWKREKGGVISDDYVLATFKKLKAEIQIRVRMNGKLTSAMISGDGLAWSKPLPSAPVRISYGTWLRRERKDATLDRLDEYAAEMRAIPLKAATEKTPR